MNLPETGVVSIAQKDVRPGLCYYIDLHRPTRTFYLSRDETVQRATRNYYKALAWFAWKTGNKTICDTTFKWERRSNGDLESVSGFCGPYVIHCDGSEPTVPDEFELECEGVPLADCNSLDEAKWLAEINDCIPDCIKRNV